MKRILVLILLGGVFPLLLCASGFKVPPLTGRVVDQTGTLNADGRKKVENAILNLEKASGGQMVVTFLNSIGSTPIEEVGIALGDAWKIGKKGRDNGAILIIVPKDRRMRLEVGYGWEGAVNDAKAGDVIRGLQRFFRKGDYADGAVYAVAKVQEFVTGKAPAGVSAPPKEEKAKENPWEVIKVILSMLFFFGIVFLLTRSRETGTFGSGGGFRGGGGGFGGGGFRGGGGGFGGGGASGRW